jgi:hypothetical protein
VTESEIDYQALYDGVVNELEQARLTILKMRQTRSPLDKLDGDTIRTFVQKNYLVIVVCMMLATFVVSSLKTLRELWGKHEG